MKTIGIKLADGSFYPILEEGVAKKRILDLTTVKDNQTTVQIDLYRSDSGSMDDAEYVDTLQVTKLNPHPNGEPDLHLSVGLDENNELTAEIVDSETGKKSETQVQLVSRTLEERENPTNFEISDTDDNAIDNSELGVLEAENAKNNKKDANGSEDFSFDDMVDDSFAKEEQKSAEEKDVKNKPEEKAAVPDPADVPFSFDAESDSVAEAQPVSEAEEKVPDIAEEAVPDIAEESVEEQIPDTIDIPVPEEEKIDDKKDDAENIAADDISEDKASNAAETVADTSFDLPDFDNSFADIEKNDDKKDDTNAEEKTVHEESSTEPTLNETDFTVPDFDNPALTDNGETLTPKTEGLDGYFDDPAFKDPVFTETNLNNSKDEQTHTEENTSSNASAATAPSMDFSNLYDKETIAGQHATAEDETTDVKKKTRTPVIICIICAIICIIATILILFVVPSKYNLIKARNTKINNDTEITAPETEEPAPVEEQAPEEIPEPAVEEPAPIIPEPVAEPEEKENITYKIKWGDTLWDLSDAYYKNPWKYKKIAKFNHIKNPDLIISGTYITIPAE